jgi:hypothetical protein
VEPDLPVTKSVVFTCLGHLYIPDFDISEEVMEAVAG